MFQCTHDEWWTFLADVSTHDTSLHQLLPHVGIHDVQRLALFKRDPWCWFGILHVWMAEGYSCGHK